MARIVEDSLKNIPWLRSGDFLKRKRTCNNATSSMVWIVNNYEAVTPWMALRTKLMIANDKKAIIRPMMA